MLRSSLLPSTKSKSGQDANSPVPPLGQLQDRYGPLFGKAVYDRWNDGGRDIWDQVKTSGEAAAGQASGALGGTAISSGEGKDEGYGTGNMAVDGSGAATGTAPGQDTSRQGQQPEQNREGEEDEEDDEDDDDEDDDAMEEV